MAQQHTPAANVLARLKGIPAEGAAISATLERALKTISARTEFTDDHRAQQAQKARQEATTALQGLRGTLDSLRATAADYRPAQAQGATAQGQGRLQRLLGAGFTVAEVRTHATEQADADLMLALRDELPTLLAIEGKSMEPAERQAYQADQERATDLELAKLPGEEWRHDRIVAATLADRGRILLDQAVAQASGVRDDGLEAAVMVGQLNQDLAQLGVEL